MNLIVNGGQKLQGDVNIFGAKNAFFPLIVACCLTLDDVILTNCPLIDDTIEKLEIMESMGAKVSFEGARIIKINTKDINPEMSEISRIRTSILFAGIFLARFGYFKISVPKGDNIGIRATNFHFDALEKMGAKFSFDAWSIIGKADKLCGIDYTLPFASVGATQNIIMAAAIAHGETIINNAAIEPEIVELCYFLNKIGVNILGIGQSKLIINGSCGQIYHKKKEHAFNIISDRLQAATYLVAAAITQGDITIHGHRFLSTLGSSLHYLTQMGVELTCGKDYIRCQIGQQIYFDKFKILTKTFPGFSTDLHPIFVPLLCLRSKKTTLEELIYENRFKYVEELNKMGANIEKANNHQIKIKQIDEFTANTKLIAHDIRGGAAILLAALNAHGQSKIINFYQICRGYDNLLDTLTSIGADLNIENNEIYEGI